MGTHEGIHQWTVGQRCRLHSFLQPYYVARKDATTNDIYVAAGHENPALYSDNIKATGVNWLCENPLLDEVPLHCQFRFQHTKPLVDCTLYRGLDRNTDIVIALHREMRALTPGQYAVFYSANECLGSARIVTSTKSAQNESECKILPNELKL